MRRIKQLAFISLTTIVCYFLFMKSAYALNNEMIPIVVSKQAGATTSYSLSVKILILVGLLTLLPALLMTMTAFTRIVIVLAILRQALGIPNVPSNQILLGLSFIMTLFVMMPFINKINDVAIQPYMQNKVTDQVAIQSASDILRSFMLKQTRKADLKVFTDIAKYKSVDTKNLPLLVLMPAYITSELKTAFEIGFLIFIPFIIIDLVVSSILMSMGMMMLSPMVISLPFKLLFFVLLDGWTLIIANLITSFRV
jgi:flagellar biosynthetic protein FliP